jgi:hypothetical protein
MEHGSQRTIIMYRFIRAAAFVALPGPAVSSPVFAAPVHHHVAGQDHAQIVSAYLNALFVEHWNVMQDEVPAARSVKGHAMFPAR